MEVTYLLLPTDSSSLQPTTFVRLRDATTFVAPKRYLSLSNDPRDALLSTTLASPPRVFFLRNRAAVNLATVSKLKRDQPCYMFILSSVTMEYAMRARCNRAVRSFASVYFEKDRSFLRARYETRPRVCISREIYSYILFYILYPLTLVGYLLFFLFVAERDIEASKIFPLSVVNNTRLCETVS